MLCKCVIYFGFHHHLPIFVIFFPFHASRGLDDECVGTSEENSGGGIKIEDQTESGKLIRYLCHEVIIRSMETD